MFPGAHARVYYNEAGEPLGWDYPPDEDYDPDDYLADDRDMEDEDYCEEHRQWNCGEDHEGDISPERNEAAR